MPTKTVIDLLDSLIKCQTTASSLRRSALGSYGLSLAAGIQRQTWRVSISIVRPVFCRKIATMSAQPSGIPGLDRQKMEEERLERLSKKRALPETEEPPSKAARLDTVKDAHRSNTSFQSTPPVEEKTEASRRPPKKSLDTGQDLEFPHGVLKRTWAFGHQRHSDIKIEEVLRKQELRTAMISSFDWDFDWLVTKFDAKTKFIFALQARNDGEKQRFLKDFEGLSRIRLCFPPMSGNPYACMHSKLMLLFYPNHLRVVVPSANCVPHDWGESGIMENSVFLIDLPRLPEERQGHANDTLNPFAKELLRFIDAMTLDEDIKLGVLNFDFTHAQDVYFVHTIGGTHLGKAVSYTGFPGLSRAVRTLGLEMPLGTSVEVDMAASSVGSINKSTLDNISCALHGQEPEAKPTASTKRKKTESSAPSTSTKDASEFRIIFPSRETVAQSTGGTRNGGTIFLKPDNYKKPDFPSDSIRDYKSRRSGLLSHNKLIYARSPTSAFLYMGSANLSHAAWGRLTYDKASGGPKLTANNWECGVLVPVIRNGARVGLAACSDDQSKQTQSRDEVGPAVDVLPMDVFEGVLGAPWELPAQPYAEGQLPWNAGG